MFKLVIQDDEGKTTVVPLIRDEITIGRKEGNTIRLTERNVSRRHARILRNNGEVHIEDLGSYNGIRVNNARIAERVSLRVSDQVQIGDYKLYLKAEGVEQVDEARTMPIERIDANGEAITTPASTTTPTVPLGVPTPASGMQLVGNPNRTLVAIADTDPGGRPVATAATVAALTTPVGYGKLVVLSSNFAGKEFELSRPQMIIGRTDENDLVINHRSISRNHAKLVRETDTGRYTVSDLQSSNGVRVNGQDYSKVELRRGDLIDLGHVRLRFIEPGEDFLFARDGVITDVPEVGGSKKGLLVAIVLGIVVLGGVAAFVMMSKDRPSTVAPQDNPIVAIDANSGADLGSDGSNEKIAVATPVDAAPTVEVTPDDQAIAACQALKDAGKWHELTDCTANIKDPKKKKELFDIGTIEAHAEQSDLKVDDLLKDGNLKAAERERDKIAETSRYRRQNNDKIDNAKSEMQAKLQTAVALAISNKECSKVPRLMNDAKAKGVPINGIATACTPAVAVNPVRPTEVKPTEPRPTDVKPADVCDAATAKAKGDDYVTNGMDTAALAQFEASLRCKSDPQVMRLAFMSACKAKNAASAKKWWSRVQSLPNSNQLKQICVRYGITIE